MASQDDYADSGRYSQADQQRRLAQLLASQGSSTEPIASGWQGAARLAQALAGVLGNRAADKQAAAQRQADLAAIYGGLGMLGGDGGGAVPDTGPATTGSISGGGGGGGIGSDYAASAGAKDVYQAWRDKGLNPAQAAAFTASWDQESGFNPSAVNEGEGAIGQGQWRGPRAAALKQFAAAQGKPWNDRGVQMDFALNELRGSEAAAGQSFFAAKTPEEANQALKQYIRYGDKAGPAGSAGWDYRKRLGNTQRILQQYAGGGETAALPGVVPVAAAPSPGVMNFLGGGGQQGQPAGLSIGDGTAPIPQPRPMPPPAIPQPRPPSAVPQPRPVIPPAIPQPRPNPPAAMLPLQPPAGQPVPPPPLQAPPIQPPAASVARTPVPRPAPAVASPVVPSAAGPATTAAIPQQRGQIFREPAMSAQEFARQGQNYLTGRPSFANQQRVAPRTMQEPVAGMPGGAPSAAAPVSPRQGLIQRLFGGGGGGGAAAAQGAPAGSAVAGAGQPGGADPQRMALAQVLANPNMPSAVKAALIERQNPPPPDPYTLSPGQTRYGPDGRPIASVPDKPEKTNRPLVTPQERAAAGIPPDDKRPYQVDSTGKVDLVGGSGLTVNTGGGGTDKQIFDTLGESATAARAAVTGLNGIREARKAIAGGAILGAGADLRLDLAKLGSYLGITDPSAVANTETFKAAMAPQVAAVMKATVGSTQISDNDRRFAEAAAGGNINLDKASIERLLNIMERAGQEAVRLHNQKLDDVYPESEGFKRERALFHVNAPAAEATSASEAASAPGTQSNPVRIGTQADYDRLPSGAYYVDDDGSIKVKS